MPLTRTDIERQREALVDLARRYAAEPVEHFVRPELNALGFEELRPSVEAIIAVARELDATPLRELPYRLVAKALGAFGNLDGQLHEMRTFDIVALSSRNENPVQQKQRIVANFDGVENAFWEQIAPVVGYAGALRARSDQQAAASALVLERAQAAVASALESQEQLGQIVTAARTAAADVGVSRHTRLFSTESKAHAAAAKGWLAATALVAFGTLSLAIVNYSAVLDQKEKAPPEAVVQFVLAKVLVFSLLLSAIVWCGRNYRSSRHNEIINRHRRNALGSFEAFVSGATDDQTKNAVLLQATQSIFAPQSSGFVSTEPEAAGPAQMIELVRNVAPSPK